MRRALIPALLLLLGSVVLGATVFRSDIAQATGLAQAVTVQNTPLPVREQNLDAAGNIKTHEQGAVTVAAPAPITDGGGEWYMGNGLHTFGTPILASAITVSFDDGGRVVSLLYQNHVVAVVHGQGGETVPLALTRPIKFDQMGCGGFELGACYLSWVGAEP